MQKRAELLKVQILKSAEAALARLIALDPEAGARLAKLEGKRVRLSLNQPTLEMDLAIHNAAFELTLIAPDKNAEPVDLALSTSAGAIVSLLANRLGADTGTIGKLHISGDAELAQQLQKLATQFDPDWDESASRLLGDVVGFQVARAGRNLASWLKRGAQQFAQASSAYVQDEAKVVANRIELEDFFDAVDDVRDRVERAERRLQKLLQQRAQSVARA